MRPILTPAESAELDERSSERGVAVEVLMSRAGRAVARAAVRLLGGRYGRRAVVIVGKGNNGGDGLVAARRLHLEGLGVDAVLIPSPEELRDETRRNFDRYVAVGGRWRAFDEGSLGRLLERADVAVDAIFGTGFRGAPEGRWRSAIETLAGAGVPVVAVDVPSGVEGETGTVRGSAVSATLTVTLGALKPGVVFFPGAGLAGRVEVADIGFPADLVGSDLSLVEPSDVAGWLRPRSVESHKREAGYVLVLAGSRAMTGAAILAATSAYRAGAGLVTVAVPRGILPIVEAAITEATFLPLPETKTGAVSEAAWDTLGERLQGVGSAAVGPGLGTEPSTVALIHRVVAESPVPFVLDADGLNAFREQPSLLADRRSPAVLTPHAGEFARLMGVAAAEVVHDRVGHARKAAAELRATLLLKGSRTVVADPGGPALVTATGGPFLATGGTGDVLSGAIAAFLARGLAPMEAAAGAAFVHGVAGSRAAERLGDGTTASDVAAHLPEAMLATHHGEVDPWSG